MECFAGFIELIHSLKAFEEFHVFFSFCYPKLLFVLSSILHLFHILLEEFFICIIYFVVNFLPESYDLCKFILILIEG